MGYRSRIPAVSMLALLVAAAGCSASNDSGSGSGKSAGDDVEREPPANAAGQGSGGTGVTSGGSDSELPPPKVDPSDTGANIVKVEVLGDDSKEKSAFAIHHPVAIKIYFTPAKADGHNVPVEVGFVNPKTGARCKLDAGFNAIIPGDATDPVWYQTVAPITADCQVPAGGETFNVWVSQNAVPTEGDDGKPIPNPENIVFKPNVQLFTDKYEDLNARGDDDNRNKKCGAACIRAVTIKPSPGIDVGIRNMRTRSVVGHQRPDCEVSDALFETDGEFVVHGVPSHDEDGKPLNALAAWSQPLRVSYDICPAAEPEEGKLPKCQTGATPVPLKIEDENGAWVDDAEFTHLVTGVKASFNHNVAAPKDSAACAALTTTWKNSPYGYVITTHLTPGGAQFSPSGTATDDDVWVTPAIVKPFARPVATGGALRPTMGELFTKKVNIKRGDTVAIEFQGTHEATMDAEGITMNSFAYLDFKTPLWSPRVLYVGLAGHLYTAKRADYDLKIAAYGTYLVGKEAAEYKAVPISLPGGYLFSKQYTAAGKWNVLTVDISLSGTASGTIGTGYDTKPAGNGLKFKVESDTTPKSDGGTCNDPLIPGKLVRCGLLTASITPSATLQFTGKTSVRVTPNSFFAPTYEGTFLSEVVLGRFGFPMKTTLGFNVPDTDHPGNYKLYGTSQVDSILELLRGSVTFSYKNTLDIACIGTPNSCKGWNPVTNLTVFEQRSHMYSLTKTIFKRSIARTGAVEGLSALPNDPACGGACPEGTIMDENGNVFPTPVGSPPVVIRADVVNDEL